MYKSQNTIVCGIKVEFDAGHRVVGHEHKCKYLHGHRYVLEVQVQSEQLDSLGRVIDFGVLKSTLRQWIDDNLDHTTILNQSDKQLGEYLEQYTGQKVYYLNQNPTAENIVMHLKCDILPILFHDKNINIAQLKLHETPNCYSIIT